MDLHTFTTSLIDDAPPAGLSRALQALWHDANGDWDVVDESSRTSASEMANRCLCNFAVLHRSSSAMLV